ncbi:MAG: Gfo/Idh/MocA family oxidoreductase [Pseudomonadota bacterium]
MNILLAGEGAFADKHASSLRNIDNASIGALVGGIREDAERFAEKHNIPFCTTDFDEGLALSDIDAVILATPTPLHAEQAIKVMRAGKHVQVEIPMADSLSDAERIVSVQKETGKVAMAGHTRRYNPSHQWIHERISRGDLILQHLVVETYFFRRRNVNAEGKVRNWKDNLLWHHACHTVDLFHYQTQELPSQVSAIQGPPHPELGIAMDMGITLKSPSGALCTLSLSFNNDGPLGTYFRYICDKGTFIARYDELFDGYDRPVDLSNVDVSMNGIELQDRDFVSSIQEGREPRASVAQVFPAMKTLDQLERYLT